VEKAIEWFDWLVEPYAIGVSCSGKEPPRKRIGALFVPDWLAQSIPSSPCAGAR